MTTPSVTPMSDDRLSEITARLTAATPGPWEPQTHAKYNVIEFTLAHGTLAWDGDGGPGFHADAEFIEHAQSDMRWALDCIKALKEALNEVATNGEWTDGEQCGDWRISKEVYEMARDALAATEQERTP